MANSLPNKITKAQAETAANATYAKYTELAAVYDQITSMAAGGGFAITYEVISGDVDRVEFLASELIADGYAISVDTNIITITWGEPPVV